MQVVLKFAAMAVAALVAITIVVQVATLSLEETIQARKYHVRDIVAEPQPGQMYRLYGAIPDRSPICDLAINGSLQASEGQMRFVNRLGEMLPSVMTFLAEQVTQISSEAGEFIAFQPSVYEVVWHYDEWFVPAEKKAQVSSDCMAELAEVVASGACIAVVDTVLQKRSPKVHAAEDGSLHFKSVFALGFKPGCLMLDCNAPTCEPKPLPAMSPPHWTTRLKLALGIVKQV